MPAPTLTFAPPQNPSWPERVGRRARTIRNRFASGITKSRPGVDRTWRKWGLEWKAMDRATKDYIESFWDRTRGPGWAFYWAFPLRDFYHPRPHDGPVLGSVAGGALGSRTYRVAFTWGNAAGETEAGYHESTIALSANTLATARVPDFPTDATFAAIYARNGAGALFRQSVTITASGGLWTEPGGGLDTGSANPNALNMMSATVVAAFAEDDLEIEKVNAGAWALRVDFEERLLVG